MIIKLIILGILKEKPCSGYDIKKSIEKKLGTFSQLENSSIYYTLKKIEKEGLAVKKQLKGVHSLKKYVYSIVSKGEKEFIRLCNLALVSQRRPFMDIDIPLYFFSFLDRRDLVARLRLRKKFLYKAREWLLNQLDSQDIYLPHQMLILKHHLNLIKAEGDFIKEFIKFNYSH